MNILVSNDDGIKAAGIKHLVKALSNVATVYVAAPNAQRSASSHALSVNDNITMKKIAFEGAKLAFEVGGTPADCVKLGLYVLQKQGVKIDAVYSGINHGGNLGTDTMYSGTVSAAAEGLLKGIPSVAVSVNSHEAEYFDGACKLATDVLPKVLQAGIGVGIVSINTPNVPIEQIRGVRVATLGTVAYHEAFEAIAENGDERTYRYASVPIELDSWTVEDDAKLIRDGYATISAVRCNYSDCEANKQIETWEVQI